MKCSCRVPEMWLTDVFGRLDSNLCKHFSEIGTVLQLDLKLDKRSACHSAQVILLTASTGKGRKKKEFLQKSLLFFLLFESEYQDLICHKCSPRPHLPTAAFLFLIFKALDVEFQFSSLTTGRVTGCRK